MSYGEHSFAEATYAEGNFTQGILIGAATLTITGQIPTLLWASLYAESEFVVPAVNEYVVR